MTNLPGFWSHGSLLQEHLVVNNVWERPNTVAIFNDRRFGSQEMRSNMTVIPGEEDFVHQHYRFQIVTLETISTAVVNSWWIHEFERQYLCKMLKIASKWSLHSSIRNNRLQTDLYKRSKKIFLSSKRKSAQEFAYWCDGWTSYLQRVMEVMSVTSQ